MLAHDVGPSVAHSPMGAQVGIILVGNGFDDVEEGESMTAGEDAAAAQRCEPAMLPPGARPPEPRPPRHDRWGIAVAVQSDVGVVDLDAVSDTAAAAARGAARGDALAARSAARGIDPLPAVQDEPAEERWRSAADDPAARNASAQRLGGRALPTETATFTDEEEEEESGSATDETPTTSSETSEAETTDAEGGDRGGEGGGPAGRQRENGGVEKKASGGGGDAAATGDEGGAALDGLPFGVVGSEVDSPTKQRKHGALRISKLV
jgi:hypothetical protein